MIRDKMIRDKMIRDKMIRFTETKTGRRVREIFQSDRAGPVAVIRHLPSRWYYVTCLLLPADEASQYARTLPKARRLAYTLVMHATAREVRHADT